MYIGLHVKCPLFLSDLNLTKIRESNCFMRKNGQTDWQTWRS